MAQNARVYCGMASIWPNCGVCVMRWTGFKSCFIKQPTTLKGIHINKHPPKHILVVFTHFLLLNLNGTVCWSILYDGGYLAQLWCLCHWKNWLYVLLFKTAHDPYGHTYTSTLATIVLSFLPISFYWILMALYSGVDCGMVSILPNCGVCHEMNWF